MDRSMKGFSYFGLDEEKREFRSWRKHITRDERFFVRTFIGKY